MITSEDRRTVYTTLQNVPAAQRLEAGLALLRRRHPKLPADIVTLAILRSIIIRMTR